MATKMMNQSGGHVRYIFRVMMVLLVALFPGLVHAQNVGPSGLPLPRFASLGSSEINIRHGPGQKYDVAWVFVQNGLPIEIIQEFSAWRKIRDSEGAEGWIHKTLLSGRRTALVTPWLAKTPQETTPIFARAEQSAPRRAILQPGVLVSIDECAQNWCEITGRYKPDLAAQRSVNFSGFIAQSALWGVYPNEEID